MLYVRMCLDKPGSSSLRDAVRDEHRSYVRSALINVVQAGPLCAGDADETNIGSFFIVEADSRDEVIRFHENDPTTKAGLYQEVLIYRWDKHIG